ncbi:MAG: MotA/TolQ/ExbB proton channel family protein [Verrucomicrobiaceae bacterium]|nr:MotA/TolQ/ExbB proton channel family protein [Verrucomicrobiaceae bacterium]
MFDPSLNAQVWHFFLSGGIFMSFIAACSFVGVAVCVHRALTLRWNAVIPPELRRGLARCREGFCEGRAAHFYHEMKRSDSPMGEVGRVALSPDFTTRDDATHAAEATAHEQMVQLEKGMGVLEVVITIAPLLGLLGTVSGLVGVFGTLGNETPSSDPSGIAAGIAEALNTTIAGLVVAVIMVIFHSYFSRRLERIAARLEVIAGHLLYEFYKQGGPTLYTAALDSLAAPDAGGMSTDSRDPAPAPRETGTT